MWNDYQLWCLLAVVVLALLFVVDLIAFVLETRKHKWSIAAKFEFAGLFVLGGLAFVDWRVYDLAQAHDRTNEAKIQAAHDEAIRAQADSRSAQAASEAAKTESAKLREQIDPFLTLAKRDYPHMDASSALSRLATDVDALRAKTDQLAQRSETIQREVEPRTLTANQASAITLALKARPSGTADVRFIWGDGESEDYAREIAAAIRAAGWQVSETRATFHPTPKGLFLVMHESYKDPKDVPPAVVSIGTALDAAHLSYEAGNASEVPAGGVQVRVGQRPR